VPFDKRTTTTTATERPIMTTVVGTPAANVVLMERDTVTTRKSISGKATISDVASLVRASAITLTNASMTELCTRMFDVLNMMRYIALLG